MTDKNNIDIVYAGPFRRAIAITVDILIVGFLRIIFAQIIGFLWFNRQLINFVIDFKNKFGTDVVGRNPEHLDFLMHHSIVKSIIIFYLLIVLVGAFYHAFFNSSSWCATIGKKLMGVILVKNEGRNLSLLDGLAHYFLSLVPWVYMLYILLYQAYHNITIYSAIAGDTFNLVFGLFTLAWIQIHLITKKKITAHDMICKTVMVEGSLGGKFPKFRFK